MWCIHWYGHERTAEGSDGGNAGDERTNENLKRILSGTIRRIWKKDEKKNEAKSEKSKGR